MSSRTELRIQESGDGRGRGVAHAKARRMPGGGHEKHERTRKDFCLPLARGEAGVTISGGESIRRLKSEAGLPASRRIRNSFAAGAKIFPVPAPICEICVVISAPTWVRRDNLRMKSSAQTGQTGQRTNKRRLRLFINFKWMEKRKKQKMKNKKTWSNSTARTSDTSIPDQLRRRD